MTSLQKRALYGLAFGVVWVIAIIVVFIIKGGASTFDEDQGFRLIMDGLWIGGLIFYAILMFTLRKQRQVDERDRLILGRAPVVQLWAVIFSLVIWVIALTEIYRDQGIPPIFMYLIFISSLIVSSIAQSLGILIGYWRGVSRD
jgi:tellurite resistance protein TehA-like permease